MNTTFEERLQKAAVFLQEEKLQDSIDAYSEALRYSQNQEQEIALYNVLGRLYQRSKMPEKAIASFQESLKLLEADKEKEEGAEVASVHNNLAAACLPSDVSMAISHYETALALYKKLDGTEGTSYASHRANTLFALAEALVQKGNATAAKNKYKEAIRLYESLPELISLKARAHYQLGILYTDEFNLFDAKTQYTKALDLYEKLAAEGDTPNTAVIAALHNNLAVTYSGLDEHPKAIAAYERALECYRELTTTHPDVFLPYVAATLSSLGILFANTQELEKAIAYTHQTIDTYNALSDSFPEQYTHYLATALHNLGLFYFEGKNLEKASHFLNEALSLRKKMALEEPEAFGPDVCATALNLVELYQVLLEDELDMSFQSKSIALLQEVKGRLDRYEDDRLVIKNMKNDCAYYEDYFNSVSLEVLSLQYVTKKDSELREEKNGTILPSEKLIFQKELTALLEEKQRQFPLNAELNTKLAMAYNDLAWLYLRLGQAQEARTFIKKGLALDAASLELQCNLAHCYLLENKGEQALDRYTELLESNTNPQENVAAMIRKDLEILIKDGADSTLLDKVRKKLNI